ncbi:MAG TPA: hypothetical protein PLA46_10265 [Phycicoccus sp.]|nr:hypothetical protein [Phycicoccus sp.]
MPTIPKPDHARRAQLIAWCADIDIDPGLIPNKSGALTVTRELVKIANLCGQRETVELLAVYDEVKRCRDAGSAPTPASIDLPF